MSQPETTKSQRLQCECLESAARRVDADLAREATSDAAAVLPIGKPGSPERRRFEAEFDWQYHPCEWGLHVVGLNDDLPCGPHYTVLNIPLPPARAAAVFSSVRQMFEVPECEGEVIVDLNLGANNTEDNFWMRRQMLPAMQREINDV